METRSIQPQPFQFPALLMVPFQRITAAEAWHGWDPLLSRWLGPATQTMLDMCAVSSDSRVLNVAASAGEQSLVAARRVGPGGHVLATDLSTPDPQIRGHLRPPGRYPASAHPRLRWLSAGGYGIRTF